MSSKKTTNGTELQLQQVAETEGGSDMTQINGSIKSEGSSQATPQSWILTASQSHSETLKTAEAQSKQSAPQVPPVTSMLADFISSADTNLLTPPIREQLFECLLDLLGVSAAGAILAPSSIPIFKGILAFNQSQTLPPGTGCTVITRGRDYPPQIAALLNATFGHSLDFDDTHLTSSLHAGVTVISTALAEAEYQLRQNSTSVSSADLLLSILIGYEVTIRIGLALSTASYPRGFHITPVAGIFGCVAVLSVLRHLPASTIKNAFGIAGSKAAGSMQYLANGSHNKRLHAGFAAHDAFLCVSLAEASVVGAADAIEGDLGLIQGYTDQERLDVEWDSLFSDLGTRWNFTDSALKPYAGCRMTHGFIEMADQVGKQIRDGQFAEFGLIANDELDAVKDIRCFMPKANMILVGQELPNKIHPGNTVDAQFSAYYQVANALIYGGSHDMAAYAPERVQDKRIFQMCDRIRCIVDEQMSGMNCRMEVDLEASDGQVAHVVRREVKEPLGERSHPFVREKVEEKFLGLMNQVYGAESGRGEEVMEVIRHIVTGEGHSDVRKLMDLLAEGTEQNGNL